MPLPAVAEGAGMVMICMIRSFARYEYISSVVRALLVAVVAVRVVVVVLVRLGPLEERQQHLEPYNN